MSKSVIGLDLGSHAVVCAVRTGGGAPELVHNEASEIQTTPAVSLRARCGGGAGGAGGVAAAVRAAVSGRAVGGGAAQLVATRPAESVASVTAAVWNAPDGPGLTVGPEGAERAFAPDQLLAMLLAATLDAAVAKLGVASTDGAFPADVTVVAAIPPWATAASAACVHRALAIAGVPAAQRVIRASTDALLAAHAVKHGGGAAIAARAAAAAAASAEGGDADVSSPTDAAPGLVVVDVGYAGFSCAGADATYAVRAVRGQGGVGGAALDEKLVAHVSDAIRAKHSVEIPAQGRVVSRVRRAAERCKLTLSTIPQARVDVENIGDDKDASLTVERTALEEMAAPLAATIREGVEACVAALAATRAKPMETEGDAAAEATAAVSAVEVVGGGARVPAIQAAIRAAAGDAEVRFTIDSTSGVAIGASYLVAVDPAADGAAASKADASFTDVVTVEGAGAADWTASAESADSDSAAAEARETELELRKLDDEERRLHEARNAFESVILQTRSARGGKHGSLIPDAAAAAVDAAEEWLYDHDEDSVDADEYERRRAALDAEVRSLAADYYAALDAERAKMEEELRKEAAEAEQNPEEKDDHDTRKLKFADRMRLVMLNKDEGNTLFRDGNHAHAALRYVKALTHADKFVGDLTDAQKDEIKAARLSLHLNASQCFIKLGSMPKAIGNLNDAVALDPTSVKALYRRSAAFESQKKIDEAERDIKAALKLAPEDAAVIQLAERIKAIRKKQAAAQAKMAAKMFGN
eukprot:TRINITY_DN2370_c0_g1_i3.p2 TRINITY_DN2370_c0_g1~~TRINITY_DN2370_c0_g1_i3.p2  ORF type:complete len:758 (+),score=409.06 TRINITY_DN2370_c0_g1_i3:290-2563(+)